jgi:lia operon protein LiaF
MGVLILIGNLFDLDTGAIFWPLVIIALGVYLILRPRVIDTDTPIRIRPLANIRHSGDWSVMDEEIWSFVGDVNLDFTEAKILSDRAKIRLFGFVGDVDILIPENIGFSIVSTSFITENHILGRKKDNLLVPVNWKSDNYDSADDKINISLNYFIVDIKVHQV